MSNKEFECKLLELLRLYCDENWENITANGAPVPESNPIGFAAFVNWLEAREGKEPDGPA